MTTQTENSVSTKDTAEGVGEMVSQFAVSMLEGTATNDSWKSIVGNLQHFLSTVRKTSRDGESTVEFGKPERRARQKATKLDSISLTDLSEDVKKNLTDFSESFEAGTADQTEWSKLIHSIRDFKKAVRRVDRSREERVIERRRRNTKSERVDEPVESAVDYSDETLAELKVLAKSRELKTSGSKEALIARLNEYDNENADFEIELGE